MEAVKLILTIGFVVGIIYLLRRMWISTSSHGDWKDMDGDDS